MIYYLLLCVSIILSVIKSSLYNNYAKHEKPDRHGILIFNAVCYGGALLISLFFGINGIPSTYTVVCAAFYAVIVCSLQSLSVYAMKTGPMALTSLISLYGMIIPTISGPIFWKTEHFTLLKMIGIVIMLLSMWLLSGAEKGSAKNRVWLPAVTIVFFLSGFAGLIEKIHQSTPGKDEKAMFLFIAYFIMFLISTAGGFLFAKSGEKKKFSLKGIAVNGVICGFVTGIYALTNLTLAGELDSTVYYPVANGGALILTVIVSIAFFHEKCTKKQIVGIITGLVSVITLSI